MKRTPLTSKTPLKPSEKPMKRSEVKKVSVKTAKRDKEYRAALPLAGVKCWACGNPAVDRHHLYPKGTYPELVTEPLNILPLCRECHTYAHQIGTLTMRGLVTNEEPDRMAVLDALAASSKTAKARELGR